MSLCCVKLCAGAVIMAAVGQSALAWPGVVSWCRAQAAGPEVAATAAEVFPHIRIDREARTVEFDGTVPINAHAEDGSVVFLEVVACLADTKEHESLVVTRAKASHVHAALLLLGVEPGAPGGWRWEDRTLVPVLPRGPGARVSIGWKDESGAMVWVGALDLVVRRSDQRTFAEAMAEDGDGDREDRAGAGALGGYPHVFAGSRFVERSGVEVYDADGAGIVVGLHTFGSEVVALRHVMSHESSVLEPEWIARRDLLPVRGTPVVVRIEMEAAPDGVAEPGSAPQHGATGP